MKKYELLSSDTIKIDNKTLHRVKYLVDGLYFKAGQLGGYLEKESNLSHQGDCCVLDKAVVRGNALVYGDAKIYGSAMVYENAKVYGNAKIHGNALVCGNAKVYENARVHEGAKVYGSAQVYGNAWVYGDAKIHKNYEVYGKVEIKTTPKIIYYKHSITITETHIFIGCERHSIEHWSANINSIGKKHQYTNEEIKEVKRLIKAELGDRFFAEDN